ncbi:peptidoglycan-binding domain-containing protein [uncultured Jannaschia sp.]|uniref:peptidoglycan-binding domain-containing protein n=1 Tax=uncultured Jannaschia sp. TaxID=293347 RepID=UPI0026179780|nr:peptidoglycan-binding domain-containing protein [uncultured Jannaschia sp.]
MFTNRFVAAATAITLCLPAPMAVAGADDIAGGIIGGIIGGAIANQAQRPRTVYRTTTLRRSTPSVSSAQRQQNSEVQTALNYFGFDAGGADGVLGARSRSAVSAMQAFLALPADGTLTEFERSVLTAAHSRAISGNPDTLRLISTSPLGARAALKAQYALMTGAPVAAEPKERVVGYPGLPLEVSRAVDEIAASSDPSPEQLLQRAGFVQLADLNGDGNNDFILDTSYSGSSFWCSAQQCKALVFVSTPSGYARNDLLAHSPTPASFECYGDGCRLADEPGTTLAAAPEAPELPGLPDTRLAAAPALPSFAAPVLVANSLASHCGKVNLLTAQRGGFVLASAGGDAPVALAEQFCLARNFAVDTGEQMVAAMPGTTMEMVQAQCASFGPAMSAQIAGLSAKPQAAVMESVDAFAGSTGMTPDQLRTTARLCLSAGYASDNMDVALGSALLLVSMGSAPHAELLGHHLQDGFGTAERPDLARDWYATATDALEGGAAPVFAPNQPNRTELLVWAAGLGGTEAAEATTPIPATLPAFPVPAAD